MAVTPHIECVHSEDMLRCSPECPACVVEPEAEFQNRRELAAEGDGRCAPREVECFVTAWKRWCVEQLVETDRDRAQAWTGNEVA